MSIMQEKKQNGFIQDRVLPPCCTGSLSLKNKELLLQIQDQSCEIPLFIPPIKCFSPSRAKRK